MKKYKTLPLIALYTVLSACATENYTKLEALSDQHKESMTCELILDDIDKAELVIQKIGEVKTGDKVVSGMGIAAGILRASLGGFNTEDWKVAANVKEQQDALDKANLRLAQLKDLQVEKGCATPEAPVQTTPQAIEQVSADQIDQNE